MGLLCACLGSFFLSSGVHNIPTGTLGQPVKWIPLLCFWLFSGGCFSVEQVMEYAAGTVYCPYWSARERSCCLGNDGLRLPVATHIDLYCRGKDFSSCPYYTEEFTEIRQQELSAAQIDRRRYRRIPGRMPVDLYRSADRGSGCVPGDTVSTVDFSYGGICFESTHPVPEATEVFFVLHGDSCSSSRPGHRPCKMVPAG